MCEKNYKKIVVSNGVEEVILDDSEQITTILKYDDCVKVKVITKNKIFKTDYARVGAFLTSYCRYKMQQMIIDNFDLKNVVRVHTDGVVVLQPNKIKQEYLGSEIGRFKIEKEGDCIVANVNDVFWIDQTEE